MPQTQQAATPQRRAPKPGETQRRDDLGLSLRVIDEATREVELSFSSEAPVQRWYGTEILSHDEGAVDLSRLNDGGVLVYCHDTTLPLGPVVRAELDAEAKKCRAVVKFDDDEVSDWYFQKVRNGTIKGISVGYRVDVWEEVSSNAQSTNGRFQGPCDVAVRWTPYEISLAPVPADNTVGVGRSADSSAETSADAITPAAAATREENAERREVTMPGTVEQPAVTTEERQPEASAVQPQAAPVTNTQPDEATRILQAERQRVSDITTICRGFEIDPAEYISRGDSIDQVRAAVLDEIAKRNPPVTGRVQVQQDQGDTFRTAAPQAILMRAGLDLSHAGIERPDESARELRQMSLRSMMEEAARLQGISNASRLSPQELMRRALTPDSQFAAVLDNTVGHSLLIGHNEADTTFQVWTGRGTLTNFKSTPGYRLSEAGTPEEIGQNGEFSWDEMTDEGVNRQLRSYGKRWGFTRQALINDDLDILTKIPRAHATAYRRMINRMVYDIINNNAAVAWDGQSLFSVAHGNNLGGASAPTVAGLDAGFQVMMAQTGLRGVAKLNVKPRYLILGIAVGTFGQQVVASTVDPSGANSNVPNAAWVRALTPVVDGDITDTNSWLLAADPNSIDTIQVDYLNGDDQMVLESQVGWNILGMEWRAYGDVGVTVLDHRGLYRNMGAN